MKHSVPKLMGKAETHTIASSLSGVYEKPEPSIIAVQSDEGRGSIIAAEINSKNEARSGLDDSRHVIHSTDRKAPVPAKNLSRPDGVFGRQFARIRKEVGVIDINACRY
jgi:hypothetical protein